MSEQVNEVFERRIQDLDFLSELEPTMNAFTTEYERLLNDIKAIKGPRYEKLLRLKALLGKQVLFLCTLAEQARVNEGLS